MNVTIMLVVGCGILGALLLIAALLSDRVRDALCIAIEFIGGLLGL